MRTVHTSVVVLFLLSSCYVMQPAKVPMPFVFHAAANVDVEGLIVFLPGFGDGPRRFERIGMIDVVRRVAPTFDVIAADAHIAYYRNQSIVDRLHADVIEPVAKHYRQVWVVGISMGGAGAASYAMEHPELVDVAILLAPYMGRDAPVDVEVAGGLRHWAPPELSDIDDVQERHFYRLWRWYHGYTTPVPPAPKLLLGFGTGDRLSDANRLVADVLPSDRVVTTPGGHKWTVWIPIFESLLQRAVDEMPRS